MIEVFCGRTGSCSRNALNRAFGDIVFNSLSLSSSSFGEEAVFLKEPKALFRPPRILKAILSRSIYLLGQADHYDLIQV
jgi:hypothetical protein